MNGSDRVTLTWTNGAIIKQWLQVTVRANANTGLSAADVFYFGNAVGEAGHTSLNAQVTATDEIFARNNPKSFTDPAPIDFRFDYNRDTRVTAIDQIIARNNRTTILDRLQLLDFSDSLVGQGIVDSPSTAGVLRPQSLAAADPDEQVLSDIALGVAMSRINDTAERESSPAAGPRRPTEWRTGRR